MIILLGIVQIAAAVFYGLISPVRVDASISFNLEKARNQAEERLKNQVTPQFAEKWPKDYKWMSENEVLNIESLAELAREG